VGFRFVASQFACFPIFSIGPVTIPPITSYPVVPQGMAIAKKHKKQKQKNIKTIIFPGVQISNTCRKHGEH
jgi:hypothetical protein